MPSAPSVGPERERVRERLIRVLKSSDKNTPRHVAAMARTLGLRPYQKRVPYAELADAILALPEAREGEVVHLNALAARFDSCIRSAESDVERECYTVARNHVLMCLTHPPRSAPEGT